MMNPRRSVLQPDHQISTAEAATTVSKLDSMLVDVTASTTEGEGIEKLGGMVHDLERLDVVWREALTEPPNVTEQSLYVLILARVSSDIFLFHCENNSKLLDLPEDKVEFVKELSDLDNTDLGRKLTEINEKISGGDRDEVGPDASDTSQRLADGWETLDTLIEVLEEFRDSEFRDSIYNGPRGSNLLKFEVQPTKKEISGGEGDAKTQEQTLRNILNGLAERRRERSFAPPSHKELKFYRDIRKWVMSTISFIEAKSQWLESQETLREAWRSDKREEETCSAVQMLHIRSGEWKYIYDSNTSAAPFAVPMGYQIAEALDHLPELQWLLSSFEKRFSAVVSLFSRMKGELKDGLVCEGDVNTESSGCNIVPPPQKKMKHFHISGAATQICKPAAAQNDKPLTETRGQYLVYILAILANMGSHSLSSRELRLYALIFEHVKSSIWMFYACSTGEYIGNHTEYPQIYEKPSCSELIAAYKHHKHPPYRLPTPRTRESKQMTPEQSLQEIVWMVEAIESVFMCSPPDSDELLLYRKIQKSILVKLMPSRHYLKRYQKQEAEENTVTEKQEALANLALNAAWLWELELAAELEKKSGDTFRLIFTEVPEKTKFTEWLGSHMEEAAEQLKNLVRKSPHGSEFLDRVIFMLYEAGAISGHFINKLTKANRFVDSARREKQYQVPLMEAWNILCVVKGFGAINLN